MTKVAATAIQIHKQNRGIQLWKPTKVQWDFCNWMVDILWVCSGFLSEKHSQMFVVVAVVGVLALTLQSFEDSLQIWHYRLYCPKQPWNTPAELSERFWMLAFVDLMLLWWAALFIFERRSIRRWNTGVCKDSSHITMFSTILSWSWRTYHAFLALTMLSWLSPCFLGSHHAFYHSFLVMTYLPYFLGPHHAFLPLTMLSTILSWSWHTYHAFLAVTMLSWPSPCFLGSYHTY